METVVKFKEVVRDRLKELVPDDWFVLIHHEQGSVRVSVHERGKHMVATMRVGRIQIASIYVRRGETTAPMVEILKEADLPAHKGVQKAIDNWKEGRTLVSSDWNQ